MSTQSGTTSDITDPSVLGKQQHIQTQHSKDSEAQATNMTLSPVKQMKSQKKNASHRCGTKATPTAPMPTPNLPGSSAVPAPKHRHTTIVIEEEDDAHSLAEGVNTVISKDRDGNITKLWHIGGPTIMIHSRVGNHDIPDRHAQSNLASDLAPSQDLSATASVCPNGGEDGDGDLPDLLDIDTDSDDESEGEADGEEIEEMSDEVEFGTFDF